MFHEKRNTTIDIAYTLMRGMGWGSCEPPKLPDEVLVRNQHETGEVTYLNR